MWIVWHWRLRLFSSLSPLDTHTLTHTKRWCTIHAARRRTPHVVRQTEIAAPSPAVLINPSLAMAALLRPGYSNHIATPALSTTFPSLRYEQHSQDMAVYQVVQLSPVVSDWCQSSLSSGADQVLWSLCGEQINRVLHYYSLQQLTCYCVWPLGLIVLYLCGLCNHMSWFILSLHTFGFGQPRL